MPATLAWRPGPPEPPAGRLRRQRLRLPSAAAAPPAIVAVAILRLDAGRLGCWMELISVEHSPCKLLPLRNQESANPCLPHALHCRVVPLNRCCEARAPAGGRARATRKCHMGVSRVTAAAGRGPTGGTL